ncbi:putative 3-hydroxybutyryl-CoA dehydrogenase [Smittium culicis]|uniref:Putative 3-hydroxybutyryl-CoA dehydrogenase n=1 Tax=Smittium culicis TaxID=133412 RepID=A0A1R1YH26_9FUNG|nr:putative 3-hydroxybutyryl-CoA dehydrogenase [Smittium culicis]
MDIEKLAVIGSGQMGVGIGLVAARFAQVRVQLVDTSEVQLEKGHSFIKSLLEKERKKERITTEEVDQILSRISMVKGISNIDNPDFVIEAVSENLAVKKSIFEELSKIISGNCVLASNTSSIISSDSPGFIANRLLMPYINEAIIALDNNIASVQDIDTTMKLGTNVPMGPLQLADFIGLDTCLSIMQVLHTEFGDSKYRPSTLLIKYVDAGWLGKKSGRGFYNYQDQNQVKL